MNYNPVVWFEIYVADLARAKAFYESVLKIELKPLASPGGLDVDILAFPGGPAGAAPPAH